MKRTEYPDHRFPESDSRKGPAGRDRRGALKRIAASGALVSAAVALPSRWTRPVVESVVLPAHAQTSAGNIADGDFFPVEDDDFIEVLELGENVAPSSSPSSWLAWLMPRAHAGGNIPNIPTLQCGHCGACARIRNGQVTVTIVRFDIPNNTKTCYEAAGGFGETVGFNVIGTPSNICTQPGVLKIVRLEGQAPNRVLVVSDGANETNLPEDPSRTCDCDAFPCAI